MNSNIKKKRIQQVAIVRTGLGLSTFIKGDYRSDRTWPVEGLGLSKDCRIKKEILFHMEEQDYFRHETAVIDPGCQIGKGTKIWHFSHIMSDSIVGENCNFGQNVVVSPGVVLGNNVKVQNNVSIYTGVICEDDVFLGPSMVFTNIVNPRSGIIRKDQYVQTLVRKGATIGANATIVCGIEIGQYAFIGAGAVVIRDVPAYALVVGNPAKHIGWMSEYGHRLYFDVHHQATCPESKETYKLLNNQVSKR